MAAILYSISVEKRVWLNDEVFELICSCPPEFQFLAGQYVTITHHGEERDYTLLSPPGATALRFLIKQVAGGKLSGMLANLVPGSVLGMSRAKGYLIFRPTPRLVFFVATGVGIAPFVAMATGGLRGFTLLHGARTDSGFFYRQELAAAALHYIPCFSGDSVSCPDLPSLFRGYVTEYIKEHLQPGLYDFYLCGSVAMIRDMTHFLDQHSPGTRIYSEAFD